MKIFIFITLALLVIFFISSCETGYKKKGHNWVWVTNDENHGSREHWIEGIDPESFKVLKQNKCFALDKNSAYFKGRKINNATPKGFAPLTDDEYGYAKDNHRVFFDNEVILKADPKTFEVLEFPYSRDKNNIFNGTIPLILNKKEVEEFKVINDDKWMKGTKSEMVLSEFLRLYPNYKWIADLDFEVKNVITGPYGTAETLTKKFEGFEEIKIQIQ